MLSMTDSNIAKDVFKPEDQGRFENGDSRKMQRIKSLDYNTQNIDEEH
jgi:hypothetical protein